MVSRAGRLWPQRRQARPGAASRQHGLQARHHAGAGRQQSCCSRAQGGLGNGHLDRDGQKPQPTARPTARRAAVASGSAGKCGPGHSSAPRTALKPFPGLRDPRQNWACSTWTTREDGGTAAPAQNGGCRELQEAGLRHMRHHVFGIR